MEYIWIYLIIFFTIITVPIVFKTYNVCLVLMVYVVLRHFQQYFSYIVAVSFIGSCKSNYYTIVITIMTATYNILIWLMLTVFVYIAS
jgi:hypothetical protein